MSCEKKVYKVSNAEMKPNNPKTSLIEDVIHASREMDIEEEVVETKIIKDSKDLPIRLNKSLKKREALDNSSKKVEKGKQK